MTKELKDMKEYFLDCNELFIDIFFILLFIQISVPSYPVNSKIPINLWNIDQKDSWNDIKSDIISKISIDTIELTSRLVQNIVKYYNKDIYWKNIKEFFFETSKYDGLPLLFNNFYLLQNI